MTPLKDFPAMIPLWTMPIAIVTGNCVILKPSERDPGAAMILADLARQAGLPDGVLNVVHGAGKTVDFILDEPIIQAISFVGSNRAGEYIYRRGTANGKRVQANLGAKNHAVVVPDCEKDQAIPAIIGAAFGAAGQRCMALTTLLMVGSTEAWLADLVAQARKLKVDGGFEADVDLGPVISRSSKDRIEDVIASAEHEGAHILLDGRGLVPEKYPHGNWVRLTFFIPLLEPGFVVDHHHHHRQGRTNDHRQRHHHHALLPRRDFRARAHLHDRPHLIGRHGNHQRQPIRQRRRPLHHQRSTRPSLPARYPRRSIRYQRPHPRPVSHVQLHRQ